MVTVLRHIHSASCLILRSILLCALWIALYGCSADKGNYDYISLEGPVFSETDGDNGISVLTHERLQLNVDLGGDFPDSRWAFEWRALSLSDDRTFTLLSEEKDLDCEISLPAGSYLLLFKVTDREKDVYWEKEYSLRVSESTSEGWMVLCEEGSLRRTRLDFVSAVTGKTYKDILSSVHETESTSGLPELSGPKRLFWLYYADQGSPFYLLTESGATRLGRDGFRWNEEYLLEYEMGDGKAVTAELICDGIASKLMIADSKLYYSACMTSIGLFGQVAPEHRFAPAVGTNALTKQIMVPVFLLYDLDSKSLMGFAPGLLSPELGAKSQLYEMNDLVRLLTEEMANGGNITGNAFERFPQGLDFVCLENTQYDPNSTSMGMVYTVLKDSKAYYLYGIQLGELYKPASAIGACGYALGKSYFGDLSGCEEIDRAGHFAFSPLRGKMYYSVDGRIYGVDLSRTPLRSDLEIRLPGEQVRCLKFQQYRRFENLKRSYDLVVASWDGKEGKLRIYEGFSSNGDFAGVVPSEHKGFGLIDDVSYREMLD